MPTSGLLDPARTLKGSLPVLLMDQTLAALHPNPGWAGSDAFSNTTSAGKHCILELYDCDRHRLDDEAFLRDTITTAARRAGATLLNLITHRFNPQGVTGLALLAESHISIHTWPESGYAAVDVFTCGDHTMPQRACEELIKRLAAGRHQLISLQRQREPVLASEA